MSRLVGIGEKTGTVQHFLGFYCCICVTARYSLNNITENWKESFEDAVCGAVIRHPILCAGILRDHTNSPLFVRLDTIDLSAHIQYVEISGIDYERSLEETLEHQHSQRFGDLDRRPAWKLLIVPTSNSEKSKIVFDAIFAFHHVLGDGKSGLLFHASIMQALNSAAEPIKMERRILHIPKFITFPPPIENQLNFKISGRFLIERVWESLDLTPAWLKAPVPWTSTSCLHETIKNYRSRAKIVSIDAHQLSRIVPACRAQRTTLTGLLSAIIVASLTLNAPGATSFAACIPYSMRHLLEPSARDEMGNYVSGLLVRYSPATTSALRLSDSNGRLSDEIWRIAGAYVGEMGTRLSSLPNDLDIGLLPWVKDPMGLFRACIGKPRRISFEFSNVGIFDGSSIEGDAGITRMLFSQSGQAIEAAVCFNVASVAGAPLMIGVTWLEGAIKERLVEAVCGDLQHGLNSIGEDGDIVFA